MPCLAAAFTHVQHVAVRVLYGVTPWLGLLVVRIGVGLWVLILGQRE
jgi:hypothetical protein